VCGGGAGWWEVGRVEYSRWKRGTWGGVGALRGI